MIVVYGVGLASVDVRGSSHPYLEKTAWPAALGFLVYAILLDLLFEDEEPDQSKRLTRWADEDDADE